MVAGITLFPQLVMDIWVKKGLANLASPFFDKFFTAITNLGSPTELIIFTVIVSCFLIYIGKKVESFFLGATMLVGWALMDEMKMLVARPRPVGEHLTYATGYSFPSGHSMLSFLFYGFIVYLFLASGRVKRKMPVVLTAAVLVLLIGISRVYLNVHYASDVLAGFAIGAILLFASIRLMGWGRYRWFGN